MQPGVQAAREAVRAGGHAATDLLRSPHRLRRLLLDPMQGRVAAATLDAAAAMVLQADRRDAMLACGLRHLCTALAATRCDAGLGTSDAARFVSTAQATCKGADVVNVVGLPLPNGHWVPQQAWAEPAPVAFDIERDPRCTDLRMSDALHDSRLIMVARLHDGERPIGLVCADQVLDRREWRERDQRTMHDWVEGFMSPLAALHAWGQAARATAVGGDLPMRPTPAELEAVALVAQGLSYKQVARTLNKSVRTISNQLTSARRKLGARNEVDLVRRCRPWLTDG